MSESEYPIVVLGIVADGQGNYLLIRKSGESKWLFPGGKVEVGESEEQAVLREVLEETGMICHSPQFIGVRTHPETQRTISYWRCEAASKKPHIGRPREIEDARWFKAEEVMTMMGASVYEPVREVLLSKREAR